MQTSLTFLIPRTFAPSYAWLGRWIHHRTADPRRAEAYTIIVLGVLALGLLLANYLAWALLQDAILADPDGSVALGFWTVQVTALMVVLAGAIVGFKPPIRVVCDSQGLTITEHERTLHLPRTDIQSLDTISATLYHRHYRRYAQTQAFVNNMPETLLLLETITGPVVLGLAPEDRAACIAHVNRLDQTFFTSRSAKIA